MNKKRLENILKQNQTEQIEKLNVISFWTRNKKDFSISF